MVVIEDAAGIHGLRDHNLRAVVEQRINDLGELIDEYPLSQLVRFVVVEPGDGLAAVEGAAGFSVVSRPWDVREDHPGWIELVFIVSDDGFGVELFVSKKEGIPPELTALCGVDA